MPNNAATLNEISNDRTSAAYSTCQCPRWVESGHCIYRRFRARYRHMRTALAAIILLLGAASCGGGERPFRMVQFCLAGTHELDELKTIVRSVAASNGLTFHDRSAEAEAELEALAETNKNLRVAHPTLIISARAPDGRMGFGATNFAEAPSQVVVGFSKGHDATTARRLSEAVVQTLSKRWRIHEVANVAETGAFPLKECAP